MVVVGKILLGKREIYLSRHTWLQMYFPETFEFLHRAGRCRVNIVDVELDDLVTSLDTGIGRRKNCRQTARCA